MKVTRRLIAALFAALLITALVPGAADAHDPTGDQADSLKGRLYDGHVGEFSPGGVPMQAISDADCIDGMAADLFPCDNVDLMSFLPLPDIDSTFVNDVWGWADPVTKMELAIVGSVEGTIFVDVTDGYDPIYLGTLESEVPDDFGNLWGDIRVYENTAYIGAEAIDFNDFSGFGVQIVDLTQFRGATGPIDIVKSGQIDDMTNSHNLSINPDSGRLYVAGSVIALEQCVKPVPDGAPAFVNGEGGSIVYDLTADPNNPTFIGCLDQDGYNHDITCVAYHGPDKDYRGDEICIGSNEDTLTVYNATDINNVDVLARVDYQGIPFFDPEIGIPSFYTHQGWLSDDHSFFFLGDELDEYVSGFPRTTYIWDFADLDNISVIESFSDGNVSIDHNMFVHRNRLYQSNYTSGLWIYDTWLAGQGQLDQRGFFDVFPIDDRTDFYGSWGNYPYFAKGKVIVTSSDEGIFVLDASDAQNRAGGRGNGNGRGGAK